VARSGSQAKQVLPPRPHAASDGMTQLPPLQQPEHDWPSQMHSLPKQRWPTLHSGPSPQAHAPAVQRSASCAGQAAQALPGAPQVVSVAPWQVFALQQPEQEAASQVHWPATQCWPFWHTGPAPHTHARLAQPSATRGSQPTQALPPPPQLASDGARQLSPEQQPAGQVAALQPLHTPPWQPSPPAQAEQAMPPVPHAAVVVPGWQALPWQQPAGHETPSQTHWPATQWRPAPQAGPAPQVHAPPTQPSETIAPQATHVAPPPPHAATEVASTQAPPLQQPPAHDCPSHTHWPPEQRWPGAHRAASPQRQAPASQRSARCGSHTLQPPPAKPQLPMPIVRHTPEEQQPPGQDCASHTQLPPAQRWPVGQAGPPPQAQLPAAHPSATMGSQATHAAAPAPHAPSEGTVHVGPEQQPPGQLCALQPVQTPPWQLSPAAHGAQAAPPVPHAPSAGTRHWPAAQQPFGHEIPSQRHNPATQCWPLAQAGPRPQTQLPAEQPLAAIGSQVVHAPPPLPQLLVDEASTQVVAAQQPFGHELPSQAQRPPTQRWPEPQGALPPQVHTPALQPSVSTGSHATQRLPAVPHDMVPDARHVLLVQHPVGQELASHRQPPLRHTCPTTQARPAPHVQPGPAPRLAQPSASSASQATQAAAPPPQVSGDGELHVEPRQQPPGQLCGLQPLQAWLTHTAAPTQVTQTPPPPPHAATVVPGWHRRPAQQPFGQESASHTHRPPAQRCPATHAAPPAQLQAPRVQPSASTGSQAPHAAPPVPQVMGEGAVQVPPRQQPFGQEMASQPQLPPTQPAPPMHAGPRPQKQRPPLQLSATAGSQAMHALPELPQAASDAITQAPVLSQHPAGQELRSQTQAPARQRLPAGQGAEAPQRHAPATHALERTRSQAWQAPPIAPHADTDELVQRAPRQQPLGHESASQLHAPFRQCWPGPQARPTPQVQKPTPQPSATRGSQAKHTVPAGPQAAADGAWQTPFASQQPRQAMAHAIRSGIASTAPASIAPASAGPSAPSSSGLERSATAAASAEPSATCASPATPASPAPAVASTNIVASMSRRSGRCRSRGGRSRSVGSINVASTAPSPGAASIPPIASIAPIAPSRSEAWFLPPQPASEARTINESAPRDSRGADAGHGPPSRDSACVGIAASQHSSPAAFRKSNRSSVDTGGALSPARSMLRAMLSRPLSPAHSELRRTHVILFAAVAVPGLLLTATGIVSLALGRLAADIILGLLTLALALWVVVGGLSAWLLVRRSERYTRLQHDFVSNVSHELRTPLTGIRMLVETLRLGRADDAQARRCLELLDAETARLASLVEEILDFGRLQSRVRSIELAAQSVDEVIEAALRDFESQRLGGEASVERQIAPGLSVLAERRALGQVLVNLLSNAFKYGGPSKRIWIRAESDRKRVLIAVEDEGPGVPLKLRRKIFREFVRGDDPEVAAQPGTGLGLAIAQRLIGAQRGSLWYEPRAGGGSRFVVALRSGATAVRGREPSSVGAPAG
jgi:two-component system phosphate regulon sensor histidine kinase PhoR